MHMREIMEALAEAASDTMMISVDGGQPISFQEFVSQNEFEPEEIAEIREELHYPGSMHFGGGAAPVILVQVVTKHDVKLKDQPRRFWCGGFDVIDGHIVETHTYTEATNGDFHHTNYFTPKTVDLMTREKVAFFWIDRGMVHTEWRQGKAPPQIVTAILAQIDLG